MLPQHHPAAATTIRAWLQQKFPKAKGTTLKRMMLDGRVLVNGVAARSLKQEIAPQDEVKLRKSPSPAASKDAPHTPVLDIIFEDADLLVVNKPAGLLTSTVKQEKRPTLFAMVRAHILDREPAAVVGLIHRLDRSASGLLIFSKNPIAFESLKRQFFEHSVIRRYVAIVEGKPRQPKGRLQSYQLELPNGHVVCQPRPGNGVLAISDFVVLQTVATRHGLRSMLQVTLHTGQKHQIRAHLSHHGTPIVNDPIYGDKPSTGRMMLTAVALGITHPRTGRPMKWDISIPRELKHAIIPLESA